VAHPGRLSVRAGDQRFAERVECWLRGRLDRLQCTPNNPQIDRLPLEALLVGMPA